jgi:hypothetical protein
MKTDFSKIKEFIAYDSKDIPICLDPHTEIVFSGHITTRGTFIPLKVSYSQGNEDVIMKRLRRKRVLRKHYLDR